MKITIVGGGTAGWLAALMIKKVQGDSHDVTVIESSEIGIVGAGEGSTGYLTDIIQGNTWDYGCNEEDFFKETGATVKLGIKHKEWKELGHEYIAPIDGSSVGTIGTDYMLMHAILNDLPPHMASDNGKLIEHNLSSFYKKEDMIENTKSHAYHFDAHLVGKYFKKVCGDSVNHIDAKVVEININSDQSIESVLLDSGETIESDFFIDASGFAKLFSKKLGIDWISYAKHLPVNTAMPFLLPYEDGEVIEPVTTAWAMSSGWMWKIPTQTRYGCGYVFDNNFISNEEAQKEIEEKLGKKIEPIRFLNFETGRLDKLWVKNCLFIGLSAAFAEPLEATSIHSTIVQLHTFIFDYLKNDKKDTCNGGSIGIYNRRMSKMYDDFKDFLSIHYLTQRDDSEFWKVAKSGKLLTERNKQYLEMQKSKIISPSDVDQYYGYAGAALYNWVMTGLGFIDKELANKELEFYQQHDLGKAVWDLNQSSFIDRKADIIDNTDFTMNIKEYASGNRFSK
jgi:flavin-dependent dehydrogenase